ncbi:TetR/AcrR family transcriptional regulator [Aequorivita vladivostokensis]|uniref:TetR family transcriptional regulator n=1 Tax=Aequorivita vladivostokensis TaxID=171194 RepID=A0ABR5DLP2_9FLAO|nr:TetR/AcrR family transcriptional regulator [Aequorivita vladivostokensis]MAB57973.1 TetR/AcrR family transcriptional regulator [Aequorivita sp.]KJJ39693.1 TetR family transcriptional regulator [Aequorivita vladivostokensis]MAO47233.1 TetR/AcrR family transcriptional regulator [Aequorivita sp.]MBF32114.1 TetR/AcrR family transcriptional regulator [Aequorivita sp.]MDX1784005.1 TetR/AcrR family transcriptional regulator [Aequorivita vladivostokensis]|tara:strand:+ start:26573 stop:27184 length:612 start_codon:yes stop_codon:yes gene_type:complete
MREKIIQKATSLFLKLGFKSVTMDDIANEMAISKKTIYTHFKNKTALVKACTCNVLHNITTGIDEICSQEQNPIEELYAIKKFVMETVETEQTSPQYQLQKYYPEISEGLKESHFEKMMECTRKNLKRGIDQGLYRSNLNIDFIARLYFLGIHGIKDQNLFPVEKFSTQFLTEEYLEYHIRGIVTSEGFLTLKKFIKEHQTND